MKISDIKEFKKKNNSEIFFDFNVKKLNWFNIGGKSKIFYKHKNIRELKDLANSVFKFFNLEILCG